MSRPTLRFVLIATAALAGTKVWLQDRYHRAIYDEALMAAYQGKATMSCQKELERRWARLGTLTLSPLGVRIGNPETTVALWDTNNPLWDVRYRHPHMMLAAAPRGDVQCAFDIVAGLASVDISATQ